MTPSTIPFPQECNQHYNQYETTEMRNEPGSVRRVIVPPEPPEFGPAAARALLRLLVAVHRKRAGAPNPASEDE